MVIAFDLERLARSASKGSLTEEDLRASLRGPTAANLHAHEFARAPQPGLSELIKGALVQFISGPELQKRRAAFNAKIAAGYAGPVIVAEGDSWFLYPIELTDVIAHLDDEFAIWDEALPADTLAGMLDFAWSLLTSITYHKPGILLLCGGGNDLVGDANLANILEAGDRPRPPDYLGARYRAFLEEMIAKFRRLIVEVRRVRPGLPVICHGYDYAIPVEGGKWFGEPMDMLGIPKDTLKRAAIVREMMNDYNSRLAALATEMGDMHHVNLRDTVPPTDWYDELHPTTEGFGKVAAKIRREILRVAPRIAGLEPTPVA